MSRSKSPRSRAGQGGNSSLGSVRIIGGTWRGRRLPVLQQPGLRPTGDRQREMLFNWLQGAVSGAKCLDLFAGSGALGFEALSRGAERLQAVELTRQAAQQLRENAALLGAQAAVAHSDWEAFLATDKQQYSLVFLDPPFAEQLLPRVLPLLEGRLADEAYIYVEDDSAHQPPEWPQGWELLKEKTSGGTVSRLFRRILV